MKLIASLALCATLALSPAHAQENDDELREGVDLLSEGAKLLLRGLMGEIEPALREMEGKLRDLNAYHPPEVLPNGDIIIRRKTPLPTEPEAGEDGEVEL
jgi:hypothetical protein